MNRKDKGYHPVTVRAQLRSLANPEKAKILSRFFKTGPGEYGESDCFLGISVPDIRKIVRTYSRVQTKEIMELLHSEYHEERLAALLIMVEQYRCGNDAQKKSIFSMYLDNTASINNWDLVDLTAHHIVGDHLFDTKRTLLTRLSRSTSLWERRIAILATFHFIRQGESRETLRIAELLLHDSHDLIHKAVGWMLREVGKRCSLEIECQFLEKHASSMPRTMLRYAIEHFPGDLKSYYMKKPHESRRGKLGVRGGDRKRNTDSD